MSNYLHPGVYVEEIPSGSKPIEGVATSVAAFVGKATKGPVGEAELIQSFDDYNNIYGDIASESDAMGLAVRSFYLNGGKSAFICRLAGEGSYAASADVDGEGTGDTPGTPTANPVVRVSASSEGDWGNNVYFRITKPDQDSLTFDLEIGHHEKGEFVVDEEFNDLSMRAGDDDYALARVNDASNYVRLSLGDAANPDESVEEYQPAVLTGGDLATVTNYFFNAITGPMTLGININSLGAKQITLIPDNFTTPLLVDSYVANANSLASEIQKAVNALGTEEAYQDFTCIYSTDHFVLTSVEPTVTKDKPLASVEVTEGALATLLRLDKNQKASFKGSGSALTDADDYFQANVVDGDLVINIDDHGAETISLVATDLGLEGSNQQDDGDAVALAIQNAVRALNPGIAAYKDFKCSYTATPASAHGFTLVSGSGYARDSSVQVTDGTLRIILGLDDGTMTAGRSLVQGTSHVIPVQMLGLLDQGNQLTGGSENPATSNDFTDFYDSVLRKVRDVSIVLVPGEHWADDGSGNPIISATLAHCQKMKSRIVIIDPPPGLELDQAATVTGLALPSSTYSVLYYPWVKVANPFYNAEKNPTADKTVDVAPSSFAAGMWSRIDGKRGVWKAPAGMGAGLVGAAGLKYIIEDGEQDQLNPLGVNCFRNMPGGGRVIWGARTLATKADPEWRYVPVRRTAIMIEQSIYNGIQWAVFEPNDHRLWAALRGNIGGFMNSLFRVGAFQGEKASDAYFVRCNLGDTMTQTDIDAGQVIVIVGFAPLKPAEFVIVRIQQKVNQQ
jgi:phage tail sheath protein FI